MADTFKHLAIKNWDKYQPGNKKQFPWIRDYTEKDHDHDYMELTMLQRYIFDGCCRLRARLAKDLHNDPVWIARALCVLPEERRFVRQAIAVLTLRGFLIPINQQDDSLEERRGEENKREEEGSTTKNIPETVPATPVILDIQEPEEYEQERKREDGIVEAAFEHYCCATEKNRLTYRLTPQRKKTGVTRLRDCLKLTKGDYDKAAELLRCAIDKLAESNWHMGRDPGTGGKKYCDWDKNLFKSYESMERWWNA